MLATISAALLLAPMQSYEIARGVPTLGSVMPYWAVEDTTLDGAQPDTALGGGLFLNGGPGRTILIRFGDLNRYLDWNRAVKQASLMLYQTGGQVLRSVSVSEVMVPWNEGPAHVVNFSNPNAPSAPSTWAATHRHRRTGSSPSPWAGPGCTGPSDAKLIPGVTVSADANGWVKIDGLGEAIRRTQDGQNYGLAIKFDQPCEFASSDGFANRPKLVFTVSELPTRTKDLEIVGISRTPWPKSPDLPPAESQIQDGLEVPVWKKYEGSGPWPKNGELITYRATIRNSGRTTITGFRYRWSVKERWGSWIETSTELAPGQTTIITFEKPFDNVSDHRISPIEVEILTEGDVRPANDRLTVPEVGLGIEIKLTSQAREAIERASGQTAESFIRDQVRFLNEVAFPLSRFSFAPNGVRERLFITEFTEASESDVTTFEKAVLRQYPANILTPALADQICRELLLACGLVDLRVADTKAASLPVRGTDYFGGLLGGDSRFDGTRPNVFQIPNEPVYDPLYDYPIDAPQMLSMTDVMALESRLGTRNPVVGDYLYLLPQLSLYRVTDLEGRPLSGAKLTGFSVVDGTCDMGKPTFEASADASGILNIPRRESGTLRIPASPFGRLDSKNRNGMLLIRADYAGQSAFAILEAWQLVDMRSRAGNVPVVMSLRFRIGSAPKEPTNLAKQRIVSDSSGAMPIELGKICDDDPQTSLVLASKEGDWIEIDLGRDRPVGELELVTRGGMFWDRFDVLGYSTGQTVADAISWIRERGFSWTAANFGEKANDSVTVRYPAYAQRFRFIRIRSKVNSENPARLAELRIYGVQQSP